MLDFFDYCVSNPPYQLDSGKITIGARVSKEIYQEFQYFGSMVSKMTTMIYPSNWKKNITVGVGADFIKFGLKSSVTYNGGTVFAGVIHDNYPVSVTVFQKNYMGDIVSNDTVISRNSSMWLDTHKKQTIYTKVEETVGPTVHGKSKLMGVRNLTDWSNIVDAVEKFPELVFHETKESLTEPVEIYIKKRPGKQPDGVVRYIEADDFVKCFPGGSTTTMLKKYKVVTRARILNRLPVWMNNVIAEFGHIRAEVYEPNKIAGLTWVEIESFDTEEEAENFKKYVNSSFATVLIEFDFSRKGFARFLPDLVDYSNDNDLFKNDNKIDVNGPNGCFIGCSLNERLLKKFGIAR